jgi:hypothetical protein
MVELANCRSRDSRYILVACTTLAYGAGSIGSAISGYVRAYGFATGSPGRCPRQKPIGSGSGRKRRRSYRSRAAIRI